MSDGVDGIDTTVSEIPKFVWCRYDTNLKFIVI